MNLPTGFGNPGPTIKTEGKTFTTMAHNLSGVITGFTYTGDLPNVMLAEGYHLIPFDSTANGGAAEKPIPPSEALTTATLEAIRKLSMLGKCAYIETAYFGGIGTQFSIIWEKGQQIEGPLISYDGIEPKVKYQQVKRVEGAINQALRLLGVRRQEDKDEFDTVGLGRYRSNRKILGQAGD